MTASLREATQMALDTLLVLSQDDRCGAHSWDDSYGSEAVAALRAALAVLEAEPVADEQFLRECSEMADALKSEYGTVLRHHGVAYYDFKHHPYAGRAGVLLRRASKLGGHAPVERKPQEGWVSVSDKLPGNLEVCDWFFSKSFKSEYWILCSECILTASVPGDATHWRPAQAVPVEAHHIKSAP